MRGHANAHRIDVRPEHFVIIRVLSSPTNQRSPARPRIDFGDRSHSRARHSSVGLRVEPSHVTESDDPYTQVGHRLACLSWPSTSTTNAYWNHEPTHCSLFSLRGRYLFSVSYAAGLLCRKLCRKLCRTMPPPTKFPTKFATKGDIELDAKHIPREERAGVGC